jgi:hypothetical protein
MKKDQRREEFNGKSLSRGFAKPVKKDLYLLAL